MKITYERTKKTMEWMRNNKTTITVLLLTMALGVSLWMDNVTALPSGVIINIPTKGSTLSTPSVYIELEGDTLVDKNTTAVEIRINGVYGRTGWELLEYDGSTWNNYVDISTIPSGTYDLQIRYKIFGNVQPVITSTNHIIVNRVGTITFTVRDSKNNAIQGVVVNPSGNITDASGIVLVSQQPLNVDINFTFAKSGYNSTYIHQTFSTVQPITKTIIMTKIGGDLGTLEVEGYDMLMTGRGTFVTVIDKDTREKINDANIAIYDSNNVLSLPGSTSNGRLFVSIQPTQKSGSYVIEVTKSGYNDYSDTFRVWENPSTPVPTPSPTPTPIPTIDRSWRPDVEQFLSNDEYLKTIAVRESKKQNESLVIQNNTIMVPPQPKTTSVFPWMLGLLLIGLVSVVGYNKRQYIANLVTNKAHIERPINDVRPDIFEVEDEREVKLRCDLCDWYMYIDPEKVNKSMQGLILEGHKKDIHKKKIKEGDTNTDDNESTE